MVEVKETSLSFSWGPPLVPGEVVGYVLECRSAVIDVRDPDIVNTTQQSATLLHLTPGVLYACTVAAITTSSTSPPAFITVTTDEDGI